MELRKIILGGVGGQGQEGPWGAIDYDYEPLNLGF